MHRSTAFATLGLCLLLPFAPAAAEEVTHIMLQPSEIKWSDAPPNLPAGAKLAVLYGDPSKPALFIIRLKLPANYKIPAHWHPTDESVTVLSGSFMMGFGDKLDVTKATAFPIGGFCVTPAKTSHYAFTKKEAVIEVTAMGPFATTYVNPSDDPSKAATPSKK
jgi:hypothetical protein